ncbi:conserved hypothetical protein [Renibacterium salmoninarum ATCC 33209]|uniref:Uncharacterized protein n=1 Tax=Renibacterium salmoninarum (strain ATCC 33209 / DSM 20767 / JCM 11484 / NBRC 15589 / NCIMB 2235) TaxID=288705 RepID=A9WTS6_RENSM|nr:hypothetical protein [Renibacterium salmoninarum]ABY24597.1 conserved hypothetical protein [Renibacterium salmoninarum ATCC 33209]
MVYKTTRPGFVRGIIAARFDFDRNSQAGVDRERYTYPTRTLTALEVAIPLTATPPADPVTRLIEEIAHGEDIRRLLGIHSAYPLESVLLALGYLVKTSQKLGSRVGLLLFPSGRKLIRVSCPARVQMIFRHG